MANPSEEYAEILLPGTVFITAVGVLGIFGNIIVIVLYCFKVKDENGDRYFIPFLALIDLLGSVTMTAYNALDNYFFFDYPSETCCRLLTYLLMFNGLLSAFILLVIAVQRYRKVCHAVDTQPLFWKRFSICLIVSVSAVIMVPWFVFSGTSTVTLQFREQSITGTLCKFVDHDIPSTYHPLIFIYLGITYVSVIIIFVALVVLYALIALKLRSIFQVTGTECEPLCNSDSNEQNSTPTLGRNINVGLQTSFNMMYVLIVVAFIVSFIPTTALVWVAYARIQYTYLNFSKSSLNSWIIFSRFIIVNHFLNPVIYTFFDVKFRKALNQACKCKDENILET